MRLTQTDSTFEASIGSWVPWSSGTVPTIARSTAQFHGGAASMAVTCATVAGQQGASVFPKNLYPASEDDRLVLGGWARAGTTGRVVQVGAWCWDAAGTLTGTLTVPTITSTTSWQQFATTRSVIPSRTVAVQPFVQIAAGSSGEIQYFDDLIAYTIDAAFLPSIGMTAAQARRALQLLVQSPGVVGHDSDRDSDDSQLQVVERARGRKLGVDVLPGVGYCRGTSQPNEGTYGFYNSSRVNVPLEDADQFDPRIDAICAVVLNSHTTALVNTQLSAQDSTFEGGTGTWAAVGGAAHALGGATPHSGVNDLKITCISALFQGAQTAPGVSGYPCSPGSTLTISGYAIADGSPSRYVVFGVDFWDSGGGKVGYATGGTFVVALGGTTLDYTQMPTFDAVVPAGAVTCSLSYIILGAASGEVHRLDDIYIRTSGVAEDRWLLKAIEGVPGSSPVPPALPPSSLPLATVRVAAKAKAIHQADITDTRTFMATFGQSFYSKDGTGRVIQGGIRAVHTDSNGHAFLPYPRKFAHQIQGVKIQPCDWGGVNPPGPPGGQYPLYIYPSHAQGVAGMNVFISEVKGTIRRPYKRGFVACWWQAYGK